LVYADGVGRVNPEGVAYYNNLINYLLQKGMEEKNHTLDTYVGF
jgi:beta-glucosidase/6-phospho-beta-glucosidase/beta-galactosidase